MHKKIPRAHKDKMEDTEMKQFQYCLTDPAGMHVRPAGELVKTAKQFESEIQLKSGEKTGDCRKIFSLMGMGLKQGQQVTVTVKGADEDEAIAAVKQFMEKNL